MQHVTVTHQCTLSTSQAHNTAHNCSSRLFLMHCIWYCMCNCQEPVMLMPCYHWWSSWSVCWKWQAHFAQYAMLPTETELLQRLATGTVLDAVDLHLKGQICSFAVPVTAIRCYISAHTWEYPPGCIRKCWGLCIEVITTTAIITCLTAFYP